MAKAKPAPQNDRSPGGGTGGALDAAGRTYWLSRAEKFARAGQTERVAEVLARVWPDAQDPERQAWLGAHAGQHIAALAPEGAGVTDDLLRALAGRVLEMSPDEAETTLANPALPAPFVADARAVRLAASRLAAGDDPAALAALKSVARDSPLRDAQRLLRGLMAYYAGDAAGVAAAVTPLSTGTPYAGAASALLAASGAEVSAPAAAVDLLPKSMGAALRPLCEHLAHKRTNQALSALSAAFSQVPPGLKSGLLRDVAGALAALGVEPLDIVERMKRAVPSLGAHVHPVLLEALAWEQRGQVVDALDAYEQLLDEWRAKAQRKDLALVRHRIGRLALDEIGRGGFSLTPCPGCGRYHGGGDPEYVAEELGDAIEHLNTACELAPGEVEIWLDLARAADMREDPKYRREVREAFAKAFPEHPVALMGAAEAALDRGAFDKAMGFLDQAERASPLDREVRAMRARALLGKVHKRYRESRDTTIGPLLDEARAIPHLSPELLGRIDATEAVVAGLTNPKADLPAYRQAHVAKGGDPWLWAARFAAEWTLYTTDGRSKRKYYPVPPAVVDGIPAVPTAETIAAIQMIARDASTTPSAPPPAFGGVLAAAALAAPGAFSTYDQVRMVLHSTAAAPAIYAVLREATERMPEELGFLYERYRLGLALRRPDAEFEGSVERLEAAMASEGMQRYSPSLVEKMANVRNAIRERLQLSAQLAAATAAYERDRPKARAKRATPKAAESKAAESKAAESKREAGGPNRPPAEQLTMPFGDK